MKLTSEAERLCLIAHSTWEQGEGTFDAFLFGRADGTFRLDYVSDHPEYEDETFDLTKAEAEDCLEHWDWRDW